MNSTQKIPAAGLVAAMVLFLAPAHADEADIQAQLDDAVDAALTLPEDLAEVIADYQAQRQELIAERRALAEEIRDLPPADRRAAIQEYQDENQDRIEAHQALAEDIREAMKEQALEELAEEPPGQSGDTGRPDHAGRPDRPGPDGRPEFSQKLQEVMNDFQEARRELIDERRELLDELRDENASQEERKDRLAELRDEQKERLQTLRETAKERREEIMDHREERRNNR